MLLPVELRKPVLRGWIKSAFQAMALLHFSFLNFRASSLYKVRHNSQICYMEAVLNDLFDNSQRRIRIVNTEFREPVYFYEPEENREVFFYEPEDNRPVYFRETEDFAGEGFDFIVCVPPQLQPLTPEVETALLTRMRGQIEYYKLYSKNYDIQWVQVNE